MAGTAADSDLVIVADIAPSSDNLLVAYSAKGLVIGGRAIQGGDLPIANGSIGAISAGPEFAVTPAGQLQIKNRVTASAIPMSSTTKTVSSQAAVI